MLFVYGCAICKYFVDWQHAYIDSKHYTLCFLYQLIRVLQPLSFILYFLMQNLNVCKSPTIVYPLLCVHWTWNYYYYYYLFNYMGGNKKIVSQLLLSFFVTIPTILPPIYKFKYLFSYMNLIVGAPFVILAYDITFSFHGLIPSLSPLFFYCVFNPSNLN